VTISKRLLAIVASLSGALLVWASAARVSGRSAEGHLGVFQDHRDIGTVLHPGGVVYNASKGIYIVSGSGNNMWSTEDDFQFVWKKVSDNYISLTADISFIGKGVEPHRKAVLQIRQSLDADSAYVDVARHGNGLTSLQWRTRKGADTHEIQSNVNAPARVRLEENGPMFYMFVARQGGKLQMAGGSMRLQLKPPFYVGIGVCSHNKNIVEKAVFSHVDLSEAREAPTGTPKAYSTLEYITVGSTDQRVVYAAREHIEAPNWTRDGKWLVFNSQGHLERIPVTGGVPQIIHTGFAAHCNNDHGISPNGKMLAISDESRSDGSTIYILPLAGGTPRRVTQQSPSYFHGWSPDGKTITFCGERNGKFDVYTIPASGGKEMQLTRAEDHNDGPEFSPDGKYIYFNSDRTGLMQIWRMRPSGTHPQEITSDDYNNWFPHVSPDGKQMAFLSYAKDVKGHPPDKEVTIRVMSMKDRRIRVLAKLLGGQGTINVPSWSPDSKQFAFVSYQFVPQGL
jgi:TolB protein